MQRKTTFTLALAAAFAGPLYAQETEPKPTTADTPSSQELAPIKVTGARDESRYNPRTTSSATRSDTPLVETPQSIQVISRQLLDDRGSSKLTDILGTVSGVNAFSFYSDFTYRGFRNQDSAVSVWNGIKAFGGVGFFHFGQDLANVERVEVLKGPSAMLFSSDQPGGTINIVTKRPQAVARNEIRTTVGRYDAFGLAGDFTGPVNADKTLLYRLNIAGDTSDTFRDRQRVRTGVFAPAFTWLLSPQTTLDLEIESLRDRRRAAYDRGIPAPNGALGIVPPTWSASEQSDRSVSRSDTLYAALRHQVHSDLELQLALRTFEKHETDRETVTDGIADPDTIIRRNTLFDDNNRGYNLNAYGIQTLRWGATQHKLLFGADVGQLWRDYFYDSYAGNLNLSIRNPQYGLPDDIFTNRNAPFLADQRTLNVAAYVQDSVALGPRWRLIAGLRFERYQNAETDQDNVTNRNHDSAWLPRLGVVYLIRPDWSVYGNLSRSFNPQYSSANAGGLGGPFDPEKGRQIELGSKWDALDGALSTSIAVYRIVKNNVVYRLSGNTSAQAGEVVSRGAELDVNGRITRNWRVNANYAYNRIEIARDANYQGRPTENAPRHLAGLFTRYDFAGTGFGLGGGMQHVGGDREDFTHTLKLPAYTLWNAAAYYDVSAALKLQLNVNNLTDKVHYVGSYGDYAVYPGSPRSWKVMARYVF